MACQAFAGFSERSPALTEFLIVKGVSMRAGNPGCVYVWMTIGAIFFLLSRFRVDLIYVALCGRLKRRSSSSGTDEQNDAENANNKPAQ